MKPPEIEIRFSEAEERRAGKAGPGSPLQPRASTLQQHLGNTFSFTSGSSEHEDAGPWPRGHGQAKGCVTEDKDFFFFLSSPLDRFPEMLGSVPQAPLELSLPESRVFFIFLSDGILGQESGSGSLGPLPRPRPAQVVFWSGRVRATAAGLRGPPSLPLPAEASRLGHGARQGLGLRGLQKYNRGRRTHQRRGLAYRCTGWLQTAKFLKNVSGSPEGFRFAFYLESPHHPRRVYLEGAGGGGRGPNPPRGAHALISHSRLEPLGVSATWGGGRVLFGGFIRHPHVTPKLFLPALGESG